MISKRQEYQNWIIEKIRYKHINIIYIYIYLETRLYYLLKKERNHTCSLQQIGNPAVDMK